MSGDSSQELESLIAVASRLPLVYKDNLLALINAVTQPETRQTLEESLRLLFSHFNSSPDSSQSHAPCSAFILQCLSALGWEKGDLVDQLESKADVTFSLETSYPEIWRMANEMKERIRKDVSSIGARIDMPLLGFYVQLICLSVYKTLLPLPTTSNEPETFYEVFDRLLQLTLSESASIIHSILCYFRCNEKEISGLNPYLIPGFSLRTAYPKIYFKLRIAEFLYHLGEDDCKLAMMAFSRLHLHNEAIDRYSPLEFVGLIFDREQADVAKLNQLAECFSQPNCFNICAQQQNGSTFTSPDTSSENFTPSATPIESDPLHSEAIPIVLNEGTKAKMSFMINRHHPDEGDLIRLDKFISEHFAEDSSSIRQHTRSAATLTPNATTAHSALPDAREASSVSPTHSCCYLMKRHPKKIALIAAMIILMIIIALILGGVSAGFHWGLSSSSNSSTMTSAIIYKTNNNPVLLGTFENTCIHLPGSINVTLVPADVPLSTSVNELPPVTYAPPVPSIVQCNEYNYFKGRGTSLNLGPGSKLVYNMTLQRREHITSPNDSTSSYNDNDCIRLYLGRYSRKSLDHVTNLTGLCNLDDSIVAKSQCLRLEPNASMTSIPVVFNITRQDDYYVVFETFGVYSFGSVITGSQVVYDVSMSDRACNASRNGVCSIGSCSYSFWKFRSCSNAINGYNDTFNVLIESSSNNDVLVNITSDDGDSPAYNCVATASFIGAMVIVGLFILILFCCICVWCYRRGQKETGNYGTSYGTLND